MMPFLPSFGPFIRISLFSSPRSIVAQISTTSITCVDYVRTGVAEEIMWYLERFEPHGPCAATGAQPANAMMYSL